MRSLLVLLASVTLFTSCSYESRLEKWCARCPSKDSVSVTNKDSTEKKLTVRDTSAKVDAKEGPEIILVFGEDCDSIKKAFEYLKNNPIIKTVNGITTIVAINGNGKLSVKTHENPYEILFKGALRELYIYKGALHESVKREVIEKPCQEDHRNWIDKAGRWALLIDLLAIIAIGLYIYFRIRRR